MTFKKMLLFAVILLCLVGYIFKVQMPHEEQKRSDGFWLKGTPPKSISSVSIKRKDGSLTLNNKSPIPASDFAKEEFDKSINIKTWELAGLPEAKLDAGAVNSLINALTSLKLDNPLPKEDRESDLSIYGLADPELEIMVAEGNNKKTLLVGKKSDFTSMQYIKPAESADIYALKAFPLDLLAKAAPDFRDRTPISFDQLEVDSFTIQSKSGPVTLKQDKDTNWKITGPVEAKANSMLVAQYLGNLRELKVKDFIDQVKPEELSKYNLSPAALSVTVNFRDQKTHPAPLVVLLSRTEDKDKPSYFTLQGSDSVYSEEGNKINDIEKSASDFRDKRFATFVTEQASEIGVVISGLESYSLKKKDNSWNIDDQPADNAFVSDLLTNISELEALDFAAQDEAKFLADPELKITLKIKDQEKVLAVSKEQDWRGKKARFVSFTDDPEIYVIDDAKYQKILKRKEVLVTQKVK
jgi:hypothetical protein